MIGAESISMDKVGLLLFLMLCFAPLVSGQSTKASPKTVEASPIKTPANPAAGNELFAAYCASCHGIDGKGGGPVAESLRMRPSDLTLLSRKNGGKFPVYRVEQLLGGTDELMAHGSKTMPVWGPAFRSLNRDEGLTAMRVRNLVRHIESIQVK